MTVIVLANNSIEYTKICIQSIRLYANDSNVILVDNASSDGLSDWANEQSDLTYVYMDEGYQPIGAVLNQVIEGLSIDEDSVIIDSHILLTPGSLNRLTANAIDRDNSKTGMRIPCTLYSGHANEGNMSVTFDEACKIADEKSLNDGGDEQILFASGRVAYLSYEAYKKVHGFDEQLEDISNCFQDISLRMLEEGYISYKCETASVWDSDNGLHVQPNEAAVMEAKWGIHYMNGAGNMHVLPDIMENTDAEFSVLEIGCDCGATLLKIKNMYPNSLIYGTEINPNAARIANLITNRCVVNNIEEYNLDLGIKFDYIIFADVLEHLRNPLGALKYVKCLLSDKGKIIISVPNLMNISVMKQLINGRFTYTETGLLDKTHIHLFTLIELQIMLDEAGYEIENIATVTTPTDEEDDRYIDSLLSLSSETERYMYTTFQYVARVHVK